jgi:hypothetical protein
MIPRYLGTKTIRNAAGGTFNPEADSIYQIPSNLPHGADGEHKREVLPFRWTVIGVLLMVVVV